MVWILFGKILIKLWQRVARHHSPIIYGDVPKSGYNGADLKSDVLWKT